MGVRLQRARPDDDVFVIIDEVMGANHGDLAVTTTEIGVERAHADPEADDPPPPVTWLGAPAVAAVRKTAYKLRVWGVPDAILTIDVKEWEARDQDQREAVIDSMLAYLAVQRDKDGVIKTDDAYRPKLDVVAPDWLLAGHARVLERRGAAAVEALTFRKALTDHPKLRQLLIEFATPGDVAWHGEPGNPAEGCVPFDPAGHGADYAASRN